jgi:hypothetical protein
MSYCLELSNPPTYLTDIYLKVIIHFLVLQVNVSKQASLPCGVDSLQPRQSGVQTSVGEKDFVFSISSLLYSWYHVSFPDVKLLEYVFDNSAHLALSFSMSRTIPVIPLCTGHGMLCDDFYLF